MNGLRRSLDALGTAGVIGIGVLVFCVPFYLTAVTPVQHELQAQRAAAERLRSRSPYRPVSTDNRADELRRFQGLFPSVENLADEVEHVYSLARNAGLELQQGEYRLETRRPGLAAYRLALPISGTYPQIRNFIDAVLGEIPTASVDALRFERKKVAESQLEAQVRFTLHVRLHDETEAPAGEAPHEKQ
jgi:hypothetical protein